MTNATTSQPIRILFIIALFGALLATFVVVQAESPVQAEPPYQTDSFLVATKDIPPFVFTDRDELRGFSIDLWRAIALEAGIDYRYTEVETVSEQLEAVADGSADVAIAAITITEAREQTVDFSLPYYRSGLGILTTATTSTTFRDAVFNTLTVDLLRVLAFLVVIILLAGHAIWLLERRRNPDFPRSYFRGVWEGIWWASVTVTTVGYGDRTPVSILGRLVGLIWMFAGLFIIANFTAEITASLTTQRLQAAISGPADLPGRPVATVAGSTSDLWLADRGIIHTTTTTIDESYALLLSGRVEAVVYDFPVLQYYILNSGRPELRIAGDPFSTENYGIAFSEGSPLREPVNRALLRVIENGTYDAIHIRWFGSTGGQ